MISFSKQSVAMEFLACLRDLKEWLCGQGQVSIGDFDKILIKEKEKRVVLKVKVYPTSHNTLFRRYISLR